MNRRFGLKALGLAVMAALALTAFMSSAANATWLKNKVVITANEPVEILNHETGKKLLLSVPAKELVIHCELLHSHNANTKLLALPNPPQTLAEGELLYSTCETKVKGATSAGCKPKEPIVAKGVIHLILHAGLNYLLAAGKEGAAFATLDFNEELCTLPDTKVSGSIVFECLSETLQTKVQTGTDECLKDLVTHLIQPAPTSLFNGAEGLPKDELLYGINPATLSGIAKAKLATGESWAGHV